MRIVLTIVASFTGYIFYGQDSLARKSTTIDTLVVKYLDEVIVSASRLPERILQSPVSVEKVTKSYFNNSATFSFFDALENIKGVQMITPSLGFRILNTRGFANTTNVRFIQMVDGMDVQSPHIGSPIGSSLGPDDLDIDNVEILPGVSSALYGMNTINGLANISTRNPFLSPGFSFQQKTGITHLGDADSRAKLFSETSLRYACVVSSKLALKFNADFIKGYDWMANNYSDLNPTANTSTNLVGADNPAADPVNSYGNESSNRRTMALLGKNYVVARSGYLEKEVVDYSLQNIKSDAGIYYKLSSTKTLSYLFHFAYLNTVYQRANRFRLQDYFLQQHGVQYQSRSVQAKIYFNNENTGNSYNLRSMAENIDRSYKTDNVWYGDYTAGFNSATQSGASVAAAHHQARLFADGGRYEPGTALFNDALKKLQQVNNWDSGAALNVKASFLQLEMQWNLTENSRGNFKEKTGIDILVGFDHRTYFIKPDGNYFINPVKGNEYSTIHYGKTGGFLSVTKKVIKDKLKLGAIIRADKNDYFNVLFNPRLSIVYSPVLRHNFRAAYQSGYRYPILFEAYSNVNSGGVKRVGGLRVMSNGIFENAWLQSSITNFQGAVLKDINTGMSKNAAIEKNKSLLKKNPYTYIKPEHVNSFEAGYKGLFAKGKLFVDADFYISRYRSFIAQANMNVPGTTISDSIPYYLYERTKQSPYRMWTNSQTIIDNYGFSAGLSTHLSKGFIASANTTYTKLRKAKNEDGLEDGFNTPDWVVNFSVSYENIYKNVGGAISLKWQNSYFWQSFLINGNVPAFWSMDMQLNYTFAKSGVKLKTGADNLLNHYYYSILGGPQIGGLYYLSVSYGIK
jgi:outer membrane receptor protein involved in Fe transport